MEYDEAAVSYSESNKIPKGNILKEYPSDLAFSSDHKVGYFFGQTSFLHKTERRTGLKLQQLLYSSESSTFSLFYYPCRHYSFTQQNQLECITDIKS
ncbi:LOW QUALITY PROTEIN: hypothetical protein V1477_003327 [Vespula maculifrons]|uniref:Uncharacterized protein n=1 Tax=Vespula maculifrons TaxID=7453 RepID=A0ABD2CV92_VESMC